jgi:opacity protein-like surface antigen
MTRPIRSTAIVLACFFLLGSTPAFAQDPPSVALRPFFVVAAENFSAKETFTAVFGQTVQPVYGGGLQVAFRNGLYFDVAASRFKKTGERAFFFNGDGFGLGIPLTVTMTPVEFTVGARSNPTPRVFPYFGAGIGSYRYEEASAFDDPFSKSHLGWLIVGGVEFRVSRWVGISGDVHYTRVRGIIGEGGVSAETGESDLGGTAGRFRVLIGR